MASDKSLVQYYLEGVSWRVLEEYPELIRDMIRGKAGVYVLYRRENLYYIGLASNLIGRIKGHLKDRHRGYWDHFSVYLTVRDEHMKDLETMLLRIVAPKGNKTSGKFARAGSLLPVLNHNMREADADRRAMILGGRVARQRRRLKTRKATGTTPLAGVVERRIALRATYGGRRLKASLRTSGSISYKKKLYKSPSAAAKAATGKSLNGWQFWQYRSRGRWLSLGELRR
jgi:hypothetical protein